MVPTPPASQQEQKSQVLNLGASEARSTAGDFSVLSAMGISDADIKSALSGANIADVEKALSLSFGDQPTKVAEMVSATTPSVESIKTSETAGSTPSTTSVSQPTKLATSSPAPPPPPTPTPPAETKKEETASEEKSKESPKESPKMEEKSTNSSESASNETNNQLVTKMDELTKSNNDLLNVMRQVLSTLQGPLIMTDSKHTFH